VTPLAFLHGVGGNHAVWDRQLPYFAALGYDARAWDQPGYGGTPAVEPYDLEQVANALARWLPAAPAIVVGHSMGGFVAQEAYARFPERFKALVLSFTSASFGGAGTDFARQFIAARIAPLDQGKRMAEIAARVIPAMRGRRSRDDGVALAQQAMSEVPPGTYRRWSSPDPTTGSRPPRSWKSSPPGFRARSTCAWRVAATWGRWTSRKLSTNPSPHF
jgi:3-oxoadipate enol-lactonase